MTNFERIKSMTVEEMAAFIYDEENNHYNYCDGCPHQSFYAPHCTAFITEEACIKAICKWLESEVEYE